MKFSFFAHARDNLPTIIELDWAQLCERFSVHDFSHTEKLSVPMFSPCEFTGTRSVEHAKGAGAAVVDLDHLTEGALQIVFDRIQKRGWKWHFYTTWSHPECYRRFEPLWCARIVFELSRPVTAAEWRLFWLKLNAALANLCDPKCKDISRCYFLPSGPPGTEESMITSGADGAVIDVDALLSEPLEVASVILEKRKISIEDLQVFASTFRKAKGEHTVWLKKKIDSMLSGESLAEPGDRDETFFRMCASFAEKWPDLDPGHFAGHFGPSIQAMGLDLDRELAKIEEKLRRKQRDVIEQNVEIENKALHEAKGRVTRALGRDTPYTKEELESFGDMRWRWLIQKGDSVWIFVKGTYQGPFQYRHEFRTAARTLLSPATTAEVSLDKLTKQGDTVPKTADELMVEYGQVAKEIRVSLTAQKTRFEDGILTEALCPIRNLEATYIPEVDTWFRLLAGDKYEKFELWCSGITRLDRPAAALYMEGVKGAGKGLFAESAARIFTDQGPTAIANAFGNFNDAIMRSPVVFADETLPKDFRGHIKTSELREFVQARTRPLNRRYMSTSTITGCARVIIAANNMNLFNTGEILTENDIEAIVERIFHVRVTKPAADFLLKADVTRWIEGDLIARHILWIVKQYEGKENRNRFWVPAERDDMHYTMLSSGDRGVLLHYFISYLVNPSKVDVLPEKAIRRHEGELFVNAAGLINIWKIYEVSQNPPTLSRLMTALQGLTVGERIQLRAKSKPVWYRRINKELLTSWADMTGQADKVAVENLLQTNN